MWFEDFSTDRLGVCYGGPQDRYTNAEIAEMFSRDIIDGLIEGTLDPRTAHGWATKAGHYGRRALAEQAEANAQHQQECACDGTSIMHSLVTFTKAAYRVPAQKGSK